MSFKPVIINKIWQLLTSAEKKSAAVLLFLMLIGMLLEMLGVGLVIPTLAILTQKNFMSNYPILQPVIKAIGNPNQQQLIIYVMCSLVGVYLLKVLFLAFLAVRQIGFAFKVKARLSHHLFNVYLQQPYIFHVQRNSAQLIRNIITEVDMYIGGGVLPAMTLITEIFVLIGLYGLLLFVEPFGALVVVCVVGIASWGFFRLTRKYVAKWGVARQIHEGMRVQHIQQGLGGIKEVKLLGRSSEFLEQYGEHNTKSAHVEYLQNTMNQLPRLWLELIAISGLAILVISLIVQGHEPERVLPTLGLFAAAAFRLMPSVNRVIGSIHALRYSKPVFELLNTESILLKPDETGDTNLPVSFQSKLELKNISYTYPGAMKPSLENISIEINQSDSIGIVGESGAGKSTLVDILLGLITPTKGVVQVDKQNIQTNLRSWQDKIGYVPQSIFLIDDTLYRNVAFGVSNESIDHEAVLRAIHDAQLEKFVSSLPDGLDTKVGEHGVKLSGGQRQRIAIARALYHNPSILVLDEASSALDNQTEHEVMEAVAAFKGNKTIIMIAHRLSTISRCNRIFRLQNGKLVEEDKP